MEKASLTWCILKYEDGSDINENIALEPKEGRVGRCDIEDVLVGMLGGIYSARASSGGYGAICNRMNEKAILLFIAQ